MHEYNHTASSERKIPVMTPQTAVPAHKVSVIARDFDKIPENIREELLTNLDNTIDVYKKAIGYNN